MSRSVVLLGQTRESESLLRQSVGGTPTEFFTLAQRVAWGLTQPDLVRADPVTCATELVARFGSAFPAHLFAAWVWRERDAERAGAALARARALAPSDHPLTYLLPSPAEWACETPEQRLCEEVPGQVWRIDHHFPMTGAPFNIVSTATLVRSSDGDLAFINPIALTESVVDQIRALGPVRWVCSQGKGHSKYVAEVQRRFPGSVALGTPGHLEHGPAAHLELDGLLGSYRGLPAQLELLPIAGHVLGEVLILHRPSGSLIVQDFIHDNRPGSMPFVNRLYGFAFGVSDRVGFLSYNLMLWQNLRALQGSLRRVREAGFTRVLAAHWRSDGVEADVVSAFLAAVDFVLGMTSLDHKTQLARAFWSQPGFLVDLVRYQLASKGRSGARLRAGAMTR